MNKILQSEFYDAISKTYKACIDNSKYEPDTAISLEIAKNGCYAYAENRMISIKSNFNMEVINEEFSCIVKGKDLLNIVKCMKDEIEIELIEKENKLKLVSDKSIVFLYTNCIKKFPKKDLIFEKEGSCVADLSKIDEIKHNISSNADARLKSVHIMVADDETKIEATNGRAFSVRGNNKGIEFTIESRFLQIITEIAEEKMININYGKYVSGLSGIIVEVNNSIISIPLEIQQYFPLDEWEYKRDRMPVGTGSITLNRCELITALNLMNTFADYVQFHIENNKPLLINSIGVYGESSANVNANIKDFISTTTVNYEIKSLLNALNSLNDEVITCYLKGKLSGFHIIGDNYYEYLSAVS